MYQLDPKWKKKGFCLLLIIIGFLVEKLFTNTKNKKYVIIKSIYSSLRSEFKQMWCIKYVIYVQNIISAS